jgi:hypothetical protein
MDLCAQNGAQKRSEGTDEYLRPLRVIVINLRVINLRLINLCG